MDSGQASMSTPLPSGSSLQEAPHIARSVVWTVRCTYALASRCRGQFVAQHDEQFGYLHDCALWSEEAFTGLLISFYGEQNLPAFKCVSEALTSFNIAFERLESVSGLETAGAQLAGYFLEGPIDVLLRALREAVSRSQDSMDDAQDLANLLAEKAALLKAALLIDSDSDRAAIAAESEKLEEGPHESIEKVAAEITVPSGRRDLRAVAFVALALAGWEPDLNGWDKNIASAIRGERALRGQYHLSLPLTRAVQRDILVGLSLERRDVTQTLDGTTLVRVETYHICQDAVARYVRALEQPREDMIATLWAPFEQTTELDWQAVQEFASQTGPVRHEWTSSVEKVKEIAQWGINVGGLETGRAFLHMTNSIKEDTPQLHEIWKKTISQSSFIALTCVAATTAAARAAVIERMIVSTVTDGSCYHIGSHSIYLGVQDRIARLFDSSGEIVFVDGYIDRLPDREEADVGTKFFALLTRAMDGGVVKPGFYQSSARQASVLRAKGPREGFDKKDQIEIETRARRTWRMLSTSPFAPKRMNSN